MKNIFKKAFVLSSLLLFLSSFLFARDPSSDFPYYYYSGYEKSYNCILSNASFVRTTVDNSEFTLSIYQKDNTFYFIYRYKTYTPSEEDLQKVLKSSINSVKESDSKLDSAYFRDMTIWYVFVDNNNNAICSAYYN